MRPPAAGLGESFFVQLPEGREIGPFTDDELRDALSEGTHPEGSRARFAIQPPLWLPPEAFLTLGRRSSPTPPAAPDPTAAELSQPPPDLLMADSSVLALLRYHVAESGQVFGPLAGRAIHDGFEGGRYRAAFVLPVGTDTWIPARKLFDRTLSDGARASVPASAPDFKTVRCPTCREIIYASLAVCPECDEATARDGSPSSRGSIAEDPEDATWLRMHWRPLLTFGAILGVILSGITLRYLAPGRFYLSTPGQGATQPAEAPCEPACWTGEACQMSACTWQQPKGVGHVAARPGIAGPFALPPDVADGLLVDEDRFAVGLLAGVEVRSTRTGQPLGLISEALQTRKVVRVRDAIYAVGPQHIAVLDADSLRLLKTLELGAIIGGVTVGANDRRVLVSLPGAHAIAILSAELHAEVDRIRFGDDDIGPIAVDDSGKRALTTTGQLPVAGLSDPPGGAVYAFDPSRLATAQDRVRASMLGNPIDVLTTPDGRSSWVALRAKNRLVPLEWLPSGAVRQSEAIETCDQPEQLALVRRGRRAVVRCNRGRAIEVLDLSTGSVVRHVAFNAVASDMAVTPDGTQVVVALPGVRDGAIALVDLTTFEVERVPLTEPPSRVRLAANGEAVLVLSDRSKVAWVVK